MSGKIRISSEQRDLLYDSILIHLSGIDAVWLAATHEDFEAADRLGQEFREELQLVIDDLRWGEGKGDDPVELTSPLEVVQRVVERVQERAEAEDVEEQKQRLELRETEKRNRLLRRACEEILEECARRESNPRPSA